MKKRILMLLSLAILAIAGKGQTWLTPFESSKGTQTATYSQVIDWYKLLAKKYSLIKLREAGSTDSPYPLHVVLVDAAKQFDPAKWRAQNKVVVMINNGIHPGEPDGIDASMMLVRDLAQAKLTLPANVVLAIVPVYNIGGCLNRNSFSRVNQQGPAAYGFRGNGQNLDLNRDFTKCDSREAQSFVSLFQWLKPDIFIDNHVSDGADYQHTFTLLTTQYNKLGPVLGGWLKNVFEPALYKGMAAKGWPICPYVNFEAGNPASGMLMFNEPPRYSSGYAALFATIAFVPETHMLKPFDERVKSTYAFMQTLMEQAALQAAAIKIERQGQQERILKQQEFALKYTVDSSRFSLVKFSGYQQDTLMSKATGLPTMFYNHNKPFTTDVKFYDHFVPGNIVRKPRAYLVPAGWSQVIALLKLNGVAMQSLAADTLLTTEVYKIASYQSYQRPYEKHHKNFGVTTTVQTKQSTARKGDYLVVLNQPANRYIVEMLEPTGDDSFFAWNFFDAILQQKEGYSDYRWDEVAATYLQSQPALQQALQQKKQSDTAFAKSHSAQLDFIYKQSPWYEPAHNTYPVLRVID
jgi:hypothetical protein